MDAFRYSRLSVLFALLLMACKSGPRLAIVSAQGLSRAVVAVEIADTPAKRTVGLMYRDHLDADAGMIFIFPHPQTAKFWMRNTEIPLDMIFADESGRVIYVATNTEPFSTDPVGPDAPAQYVLEVNGGFASRYGIKPGDRFEFRGFTPHARN